MNEGSDAQNVGNAAMKEFYTLMGQKDDADSDTDADEADDDDGDDTGDTDDKEP